MPAGRTLGDLARDHARLVELLCVEADWDAAGDVVAIVLRFEGGEEIVWGVDPDTDELVRIDRVPEGATLASLAEIHPSFARARGLFLAWAWEMTNTQGYLDAVQLELRDGELKAEVILQFKVVASGIRLFDVRRRVGSARSGA